MLIRHTAHFVANLERIEAWWDEHGSPSAFDRLLAELQETTLPTLAQHPGLGRDFFQRSPESMSAKARVTRLGAQVGPQADDAQVREYVMTGDLLLYRIAPEAIDLLAIRHHQQLSFDIETYLSVR